MSGPKEGLATTQIETVQLKVGLVLIHTRASAGDPGTPTAEIETVETVSKIRVTPLTTRLKPSETER